MSLMAKSTAGQQQLLGPYRIGLGASGVRRSAHAQRHVLVQRFLQSVSTVLELHAAQAEVFHRLEH